MKKIVEVQKIVNEYIAGFGGEIIITNNMLKCNGE